MSRIALTAIAFDAGTQIRAALDQQVVADYAEAMTAGAQFPPIVLFHDGSQHYLADGFHRFMAAQRIEWRELDAEIRPGTKGDALWFALGANRNHGKQLTVADKKHAVELALSAWPNKSNPLIAEQVGCSHQYVQRLRDRIPTTGGTDMTDVIGRNGKRYPAHVSQSDQKRESIRELVASGKSNEHICRTLRVSPNTVVEVKRAMGISARNQTRVAVRERREQIRSMATAGYSGQQIADAIGLTPEGTRAIAKQEGIEIQADKVVGKLQHHNSNRIVAQIVADAENLTEGVNLVDFADLDRSQLADWLRSLQESRDKLGTFIRRLMKEQQNGQAA